MRTKVFIVSVAGFLMTAAFAPAVTLADTYNPSLVGQVGGVTNVSVYDNGQLYFNIGPRIVKMAVSSANPAAPIPPETYGSILAGVPQDIKIANGAIYVALGYGGVAVVDKNTLQTLSAQSVPSTTSVSHVAVGTSILYAAAGRNGILQYNLGVDKKTLTYNTAKVVFPSPPPFRNITDVATHGSGTNERLYVSADNNVITPTLRGGVMRFDIYSNPVLGLAENIKEQIDVETIKVTDSFVYAGGNSTFYVMDSTGLGGNTTGSIQVGGEASAIDIGTVQPNIIYLVSGSGIDVLDVSNPASPMTKTLSSLGSPTGTYVSLAAVDFNGITSTLLYIADFNNGLTIGSSPHATPQNLSIDSPSYVAPKTAVTSVAEGAMHQAFTVSDAQNVITFNVSTPGVLSRITGAGLGLPTTGEFLAAYNDLLLASDGALNLQLYRINPGAIPTLQDNYIPVTGTVHQAVVAWPNAIVADGAGGLLIVNISGTMSLVGHVDPLGSSEFTHVAVSATHAYVSDANGAFFVYDISDTANPTFQGTTTRPVINDIKMSGNFAYLAAGNAGVEVLDVTIPTVPAFHAESGYVTPGYAYDLAIYNDHLYVADGRFGVVTLLLEPGAETILDTNTPTPDSAFELAVVPGDGLYVADSNAGLLMYRTLAFAPLHYYLPVVLR